MIKQQPATTRPFQPARSRPICMLISVLLGPGIRLVAPTRSRKCCDDIHCRFLTTSSCISAICAAGPPKPIVPNFRNSFAISVRPDCWLPACVVLVVWFSCIDALILLQNNNKFSNHFHQYEPAYVLFIPGCWPLHYLRSVLTGLMRA